MLRSTLELLGSPWEVSLVVTLPPDTRTVFHPRSLPDFLSRSTTPPGNGESFQGREDVGSLSREERRRTSSEMDGVSFR